MIQINDGWRIKGDGKGRHGYKLEKLLGLIWLPRASYSSIAGCFKAYLRQMLVIADPTSPSDLLALLRKLTAEIEAAVKEAGE